MLVDPCGSYKNCVERDLALFLTTDSYAIQNCSMASVRYLRSHAAFNKNINLDMDYIPVQSSQVGQFNHKIVFYQDSVLFMTSC